MAKFALLMAARKSIGSRHSLSEREIFLHLRDIEQGLEQMKRLPLKDVKVPLIPSGKPGFTGIVLNVMQGCNVYESITLDDSGFSFRARGRARAAPRRA
ncbi:hypothetical protein HF878_02870 [Selenomonas bovis]|uniref:ShlB POTRA domain-containing protein n=2 Tax=Selenomonas bovis TaxID=416586 RepID=A0A848BAT0_9FIRM|nr:hypothetical protein [Selenomonas bovis]